MSTKANSNETERLNSIKQRLEQMVERKWTPLCEKHDLDRVEVWIQDGKEVCVGRVNKYWSSILLADVIRTFNRGHYTFWKGPITTVRPKSGSNFYEVTDGMDVYRAAVIKALDKTGIHVPKVSDSSGSAWLEYFETEVEAQRAAAVLEDPIEEACEQMWNSGVEELEVREFKEPREFLSPGSWYAVIVHYE
jgi:hypothetical protein